MGIASFSPFFSPAKFGATKAPSLFAPVRALAAFFMPAEIERPRHNSEIPRPVHGAPKIYDSALNARALSGATQRSAVSATTLVANPAALAVRTTSVACTTSAPLGVPTTCGVRPANRLKIVREYEPGRQRSQSGRMAISGRMADVCDELERIASKESLK